MHGQQIRIISGTYHMFLDGRWVRAMLTNDGFIPMNTWQIPIVKNNPFKSMKRCHK